MELKKVNGTIYTKDVEGNIVIIQPAAQGSGRVYWCACNDDGEVLQIAEGRKDKMTVEDVLASHYEAGENISVYQLNIEEYGEMQERMLNEPVEARGPTGRVIDGKMLQGIRDREGVIIDGIVKTRRFGSLVWETRPRKVYDDKKVSPEDVVGKYKEKLQDL